MPRRLLVPALAILPTLVFADTPSDKVQERYKQMLRANPGEGTALDRLWKAAVEQGKTGPLIAEFEKDSSFGGQMVAGLLYQKAGRTKEALGAFQNAQKLDPKNPSAALAMGRIESAVGNAEKSAGWFQKALEAIPDGDPRKTEISLQLGASWLAAGKLDQAGVAWEKTAALSPKDLSLRRQLAETYLRNHLSQRALFHLQFIEQNGTPQERAQALQDIAGIHQAQGAQDDAIRALEKAIGYTAPGNWLREDLLGQLVRLHQRYHRVPELEERWKRYVAENPRDLAGYLQLIELFARTGDQAQQLTWLDKLIALAPRSVEYRLRRARLLAQMDDLERAAAAYDELLTTESQNIELVFERARLDVQRDQPKSAGQRIAQLLARSSQDESIRVRALEFYQTHRLYDLAERHLAEDARNEAPEQVLALANFYFARDRGEDARRTLDRLVKKDASAPEQAASWFRIAGVLREQNEVSAAVQVVRKAIDLQPDARPFHFMVGELEASTGHYAAAEVAFERAFVLSKTASESLEADQRLYDVLRNQKQPGEDDPRNALPRPDSAATVTSRAAQAYLLKILRDAVDGPTEERWLRVARWQQWSRNSRGAIDAAERALSLNPKSLQGHDFLARLFATDPQGPGAQKHLRELVDLDQSNRATYLRRLGQAELQGGRSDEALKIFRQLVDENPGDPDALNDLSIAYQRAEQWTDALGILQRVYNQSPASRKREAAASLLRVYDRLAMRQEAAQLLLAQVDAEQENKDRFAVFADLLTHCSRHGLLDWLHGEFEKRHRIRVDDYFTEIAYGRILKAEGNKVAAFEVLSDAAFVSPDPSEALPELVREAEELHRLDAAIQLQSQLVRIVAQPTPEGLERLAQLQERALHPDAAAQTWSKLTSHFPRDVVVLEHAVEFERTWGTPARAISLLKRILSVEPANMRTLASLAELSLSDGDVAEAESALEKLLEHTEPEPETEVKYPALRSDDPSRLEITYRRTVGRRSGRPSPDALKGLRAFWLEKPEDARSSGHRQARLEAIRELGRLTADKDTAAKQRWIARWRQPGLLVSEKLWALYYAGASGALLDDVQKMMSAKPDDPNPINAFIWLALQTGEFDRLAAWNRDPKRTTTDRDYLVVALEQYFEDRNGPLPAGLLSELFPDAHRMRLWQISSELAQRGYFTEAIDLRKRVYERFPTQRALCGFELAQWYIFTGQVDAARKILRASLGATGDNLADATYSVMRALYLLSPENERPALRQEILAGLSEKTPVVHATLTRLLMAALSDDEVEAKAQIERLLNERVIILNTLADRATAATRQWDYVITTGTALQSWQFDRLAAYYWERAVADRGNVALQIQVPAPEGEGIRAKIFEVRTRLAALRMIRAVPFELDDLLEEYSQYSLSDGLLPLAEMIESFGANPVAISVYRRLWEREPSNPHALRNLLSACRNAGDWETLEEILDRVVTEGIFRQNDAAHRDLMIQYADVLDRRQEYGRARTLVAGLMETAPRDARMILKVGHLYEANKEMAAAEECYRKFLSLEPTNVSIRIALAELLDSIGQTAAAVDILERAAGAEIDGRLARLNLKVGRFNEALAALERVPVPEHSRVAITIADVLEKQGDLARARLILNAALAKSREEPGAYAVQARLVQLLSPEMDRQVIEREVRRLRQFADSDKNNGAEYFVLMERESARLGVTSIYRDELARSWDAGRGDITAGAALIVRQLQSNDRPGAVLTWRQLAASALLDASSARRVGEAFGQAGDHEREAEALGKASRLDALDYHSLLPVLRALEAIGHHDQARGIAAELGARSIFSRELLAPTGEAYAELKDVPTAREYYAQAVDADPTTRQPEAHIALARIFLELHEYAASREVLRRAALNPSVDVVAPMIEYLTRSGQLPAGDEMGEFQLLPNRLLQFQHALVRARLDAGLIEPALQLAEARAGLLDDELHAQIRAAAKKSNAFATVASWLDRRLAQKGESRSALVALLADWAEAELTSLQVDAAVDHLQRAHELQAGSWRVTERLVELRLQRGEPGLAAKTINAFLAVATDATEKEKARQLLARIPSA